jgi:bifunctional non-homologous end joining protein LigD
MLAQSGRGQPIDPARFAVEPKWDGWRGIVRLTPDRIDVRSRNRRCLLATFPQLAAAPVHLTGRTVMLDGEIVAFDKAGKPDFHRLGFGRGSKGTVAFVAFDVLYLDDELLIDQPYSSRRRVLEELALGTWPWLTTPAAASVNDAGELWDATRELGLEGVVAKLADAPYRPGHRGSAWLKLKHPHARDLQVSGSDSRWAAGTRRSLPLPAIACD